MNKTRKDPNIRAEEILLAAVEVAAEKNYKYMTREEVAKRAQVTDPLVTFHFGCMETLKTRVLSYAIANGILAVIAQGVMCQDPVAMAAPKALRNKALRQLMGS